MKERKTQFETNLLMTKTGTQWLFFMQGIFVHLPLILSKNYLVVFSSACIYSAELLSWRRRTASVFRPSVRKSGFSETAAWIQTKFYGKLPIHHISRPFFCCFYFLNFQFSNRYDFFQFR